VNDPPGGRDASSAPGELRTFLIADVRGYTLFTQQRGDEAAAALATHFAGLTREIIEEHGGAIIEFRGDEALCAFTSARRAINAATLLQERFVDATEADPENPLPVGIGLDAGEAVPVGEGYRGAALNLAARLCARAGPGEVLASAGVVHLAGRIDGIRYIDLGTARFKNVPAPVGVIKVLPEKHDPAERLRLHWQPPAATAPRRSRVGLVAAGVVLAILAASLPFVLRDDSLGGHVAAGSIGILDSSGHLTRQVPVGDAPGAIAVGPDAVWVTDVVAGTLARLDPRNGAVQQRIAVGGTPSGMAVSEGHVWVADTDGRRVLDVNPGSEPGQEQIVASVPVGNGPVGMAAERGQLWVANSIDATVTQIETQTGEVVGTHAVGSLPTGITVGGGRVWVSERGADAVAEIDPATGVVVREIPVGRAPTAIAWSEDAIWVVNEDDDTVSRIDPGSGSVTSTVKVGTEPVAIAVGAGVVHVANAGEGTIAELEADGSVRSAIPLANAPRAVAVIDGSVWVAVQASATSHRGDTLSVAGAAEDGLDSLDPANIFDRFALDLLGPVLAITNDGLVALRRVGGLGGSALVPDLATALPVPTNDGRTYSFVLRTGVRFSTGAEVMPSDVRATFERLLSQPGASENIFLRHALVIEGAEACTASGCDLSSGIDADDGARTVTFTLTRPDPDFLRHLALPSFVILPAGTPAILGTTAPAATGPYVVTSFTPFREIVLERNRRFREWSSDAQPDGFVDRIVVAFGMSVDEQVDAILQGDLDVMYFEHPTAERLAELQTQHPQQLHPALMPTTMLGLFLNTQVPPFDDLSARRAVAFALDRAELARLFGEQRQGIPVVTCNLIGPGLPGYVPYCPFTRNVDERGIWSAPDVDHAGRLMEDSGTRGAAVTVSTPTDFEAFGREVVRVLDGLGYRTSMEVVAADDYEPLITDPDGDPQIGLMALDANSGAPSELIARPFSCPRTDADYSLNLARFCDRSIERRIARALALQETDQYAANRAWAELDHDLVDRAAIIPFGIPAAPFLVSERVGNYQQNALIGVLLARLWVR
jgi:peptide/nickel transport system substrate-binding protein